MSVKPMKGLDSTLGQKEDIRGIEDKIEWAAHHLYLFELVNSHSLKVDCRLLCESPYLDSAEPFRCTLRK
jgi:hypothetical protein